ncbi:TlpA family protein disulfide reductase [Streptomyces sp. HB2AG]|uniref:TlpA family protein disulfide reductase n=1 Tax=Streptomyces sp. HB2AG TaxID=2983400 RepID=UPI0022AA1282|nr:TlpA disulfide reductase family protein [Streptomyces sp. HB2AG]MCZ2524042.1 TlpA disulfide reductase family protein [Streptomyces sp. HB2AG]
MSWTQALSPRPFRSAAALAGAAALVLALASCSTPSDDSPSGSSGSGANFVEGTGAVTKVPVAERKKAPDISGETVDGGELSLSDYRGKVVVLNVWGSWCAPCRAEAKHLAKVSEDTEAQGVQFVGLNTRDMDTAQPRAFERTYGIEYPSLYDPYGKQMLKFPKNALPPQTIPTTLIIDREGRIAVRLLKEVGEEELRKALDPVIAEKA